MVDVEVSQFKLTQAQTCINSVSGSGIWRSNGSYDGLRCWVMRYGGSGCTGNEFSCTYFSSTKETSCTSGSLQLRATSCTSSGCVIKQGSNTLGSFQYGSSANYVFRSGSAPSFPFATCSYADSAHQSSGHPTFTQSTSPL